MADGESGEGSLSGDRQSKSKDTHGFMDHCMNLKFTGESKRGRSDRVSAKGLRRASG